jgi:hypothetical protein
MRTRLILLAAALTLQMGCIFGVNEKNWNKRSAKQFCKYQKRCNATEFYANFDAVGTCTEAEEAMLTTLDGYYANCAFNKENAKSCLSGLKSGCKATGAEFDLLFAPCWQVYDCAQNFGLGDTGDSSTTTTATGG